MNTAKKKRGALGAGAVLAERQVKALLKKKAPEPEESNELISADEGIKDDEESGGEGEEAGEKEEAEEEKEDQVIVSQRKVVVPKIISQKGFRAANLRYWRCSSYLSEFN